MRLVAQVRGGRTGVAAVARAGASGGAKLKHALTTLSAVSFDVPAAAAPGLIRSLSARQDVMSIVPAAVRRLSYQPNGPFYPRVTTYLAAVGAPAAWEVTKGSASVKIAVIDSGIDNAHPDLVGKVVGSYNAVDGTTDVSDSIGHGTMVAGVAAAASDNAVGTTGVGFNSSLLAVKVADAAGLIYTDDVAAGIVWAADNGADVVNLSLGSAASDTTEANAISYARSRDVVVVAAAGNAGDTTPIYPAAYPGVLAVGATDAAGNRASFSSYGSWVSVGAPGVGIFSTAPQAASDFQPDYDTADGTSFSSPIVAGQVALLAAAAPTSSAAVLRSAVVSSAHGYSGLGLGAGQIDILAALQQLPPNDAPTITSPAQGSFVAGALQLTASSTAPAVQFAVDGKPVGALQTVSSGTAGLVWESWAVADGNRSLTASACNAFGCGSPSAPVTVTVQNPAPVITSPVADEVVQDVVAVRATVSAGAPKARLSVDGVPVGPAVAVMDCVATLPWPSAGSPDGQHLLTVAACSSAGLCSSDSAVTVSVLNVAPVVTRPLENQLVSGPTTLTATGPSGGKLFRRNGVVVGFDGAAPYTQTFDFSTVPDGTHTLTVQSCGATASTCRGLVSRIRTVRALSLRPVLTRFAPTSFSPNGDKRLDTTTISFTLPDAETVRYTIVNPAGAVVRGPVGLGTRAAGSHSFVWNGLTNAGSRAPDGLYTVVLSTSRVSNGTTLYGTAKGNVRVDTVAPTLTGLVAYSGTLFPYPDGYRDTMAPKVTIGDAGVLTLTVRNSLGSVVKVVTASRARGTHSMSWNGRNASGALVPAGTYRYTFTIQDPAQNRRSSSSLTVGVSAKRLIARSVSTLVTPAATTTSLVVGGCSAVSANSTWSGGYDYLSDYLCHDPFDSTADIAGSEHQLVLPAAVKYTGIRLAVTGQRRLAPYDDIAFAWYRTPADDLVNGLTLGSSYATRPLVVAPSTYLAGGRTLRWVVATNAENYYSVRSFTVSYTYHTLG